MSHIICKWDLTCKVCTVAAVLLSGGLIFIGFYTKNQLSVLFFILSFLLLIPLFFSPRSISIENDKIRIKMLLWSRFIPLNEYYPADANKFPLRQSIKVLSSFGIGGHMGIYYYKGIGLFQGCFTDYRRVTILRNKRKKKFIVLDNFNSILDKYYSK